MKIILRITILSVAMALGSCSDDYSAFQLPLFYSEKGVHFESADETDMKACGTAVDADKLYIANEAQSRVEIFNRTTGAYIGSFAPNMQCRYVSVTDSVILVTGIKAPQCQVSIYNRNTHEYIGRLGNGQWSGPLSHTICATASDKYFFTRDQGSIIKVFDRSKLKANASLGVHARLKIDDQQVYNTDHYSMAVADGMLYAVNMKNRTIYQYDVTHIAEGAELSYRQKTEFPQGATPRSIAVSDKYVYISGWSSGKAAIYGYLRATFARADISKPYFTVGLADGEPFNDAYYLSAEGSSVYLTQDLKTVLQLSVKENYADVVKP